MVEFTGKSFLSERGRSELNMLRIGEAPAATGGRPPIEMLARVPSEECGCPEELWSFDGLLLLFHFEADGTSDAFIFAGEWEKETSFRARNLDELRALSFSWIAETLSGIAVHEAYMRKKHAQ